MTFETRQANRSRTLERMAMIFQAIAIAYLALHATVAWLSYAYGGALSAMLTLITLGFGDLYWAFRWASDLGAAPETLVASIAALGCFASWIARPMFDQWAHRFTSDMLADAASEITDSLDADNDSSTTDGAADPAGPPR